MVITLKEVNQSVERLLHLMNAEFGLKVFEVKIAPDAKMVSCFFKVKEKVKRNGGKVHYDWAVWQHSYLIEAEAG